MKAHQDYADLARFIDNRARTLGFAGIGVSHATLSDAARHHFDQWLSLGRHGGMDYMAKHWELRTNPPKLVPDTVSIISVCLPYWPQPGSQQAPTDTTLGNISCYALGRDYHKTLRQRLQKLADQIEERLGTSLHSNEARPAFNYRVFSDSAPVMETEFAQQSGIAWRGKHTLTLTRQGSWHFLGEIYTNLPLPPTRPTVSHCGSCRRCLDACPTNAFIAPYELDARRCISYLTIEWQGSIPHELRPLIGNRIYGCDDCQLVCPWNRFAKAGDPDFAVRNGLDRTPLTALFSWTKETFEERLAGSPIRRIGHERWLRNIAVALGNAMHSPEIMQTLASRSNDDSALIREHVAWAIDCQQRQSPPSNRQTVLISKDL